ncbi:oligosaccharide flippase family protein [Salinirubrum litoreum]|uniref:Oligosaccharide flippase family protein n=1 Tax=Salinirubrum litoreum TaxID=1126234 RepID=A0ABD5RFD6_9EURY|nr:oligosaccharide flippase family protein [Salinirubrum litoreum]
MFVDQDDVSKLLSSASLVVAGSLIYSVAQLFERIIIARALDPGAYGEVSIGLTVMGISATFALLGFSQGIPRFMSKFENPTDVRGTLATGLLVAVITTTLITAILLLNAEFLARTFLDPGTPSSLITLFALAVPFVVLMRLGIGGIRGQENTRYKVYAENLLYPGLRLGLIAGLLGLGYGIQAAGYAYLTAAAVSAVFAVYMLHRLFPLVGDFSLHTREMLTFSAPLVVSSLLSVIFSQTDTLMIGYFHPSEEVGFYSAAYPLATGLNLVLTSFGFMYLPVATRLDTGNKREEVDAVYKLTTKWIFVLTFPLFLTLAFFSSDVLTVVFGAEYAVAGLTLTILTIGYFTHAAAGRSKETFSALGFTKYVLLVNAISFGLNFVLNLLLIPDLARVGAAIGSATAYILGNVITLLILNRNFGISPFSRWSIRTFVALPVVMLPLAYLVSQNVEGTFPILAVFGITSAALTLVVLTLSGGLQPEDIIPVEYVETALGVRIPYIRRFIPEDDSILE